MTPPPVLDAPVLDVDSPHIRIVDATLRCIGRWGLAKTTLDDVAREACVGRATLYRLFPGGRDALFEAVMVAETARFLARLDAAVTDVASLEDLLVVGILEAAGTLSDHPGLRFLIAHEPEAILPYLAFQRMDALLRTVGSLVGPYLVPWLSGEDGEAAARGAEWVARIVLSYLIAPSTDLDFTESGSVRRLVRTFILPGLVPAVSPEGDHS